MDIRPLTETYAVAPQIEARDMAAVKAAGFALVIDNRPDGEVGLAQSAAVMRAAAEAAGLAFVENPVIGGALTLDNVTAQRQAIDSAAGPVLAYCASGNRSSVVWALAMAGRLPTEEMIARAARYGYQLAGLAPQIEALAAKA